jgi:hypothetical protein
MKSSNTQYNNQQIHLIKYKTHLIIRTNFYILRLWNAIFRECIDTKDYKFNVPLQVKTALIIIFKLLKC